MTAAQPDQPWRIGTSWGIHVYQGEKGSPGERPVATFHDPADAQRAVDAVNGGERGSGEMGPPERQQGGELLAQLARAFADHVAAGRGMEPLTDAQFSLVREAWQESVAALLPVVTAYAERQARERAAEELRRAAVVVRICHGMASPAAEQLDARVAALTADERPAT